MSVWSRHKIFETNSIILIVGILLVIAVGGLVEITPLFYLKSTIEKVDGKNLQVAWNGGSASVVLAEGVQVVYRDVVKLDDLQPGAKVTANLREGTAVNVTVE